MRFSTQSMYEIYSHLNNILKHSSRYSFEVLDPDLGDAYAGTPITLKNHDYLYRSYKSWNELAELLGCKMLTPLKREHPWVKLTFQSLKNDSFHSSHNSESKEEKYGKDSAFWQIRKLEEPAYLHYYIQALKNVKLSKRKHILDLGVHRGDELLILKEMIDTAEYQATSFTGIDHSMSAIAEAQQRFPQPRHRFICSDINQMDSLKLDRYDLLISIGTLQSPGIPYKPLLMDLVQNYLNKEDSALILGFPNCRWVGGEMCYGAKSPNYAMSEMGLLFNDVIFAKKYLQQHHYRVTITGKTYIFLTATKIASRIKDVSL